MSNTWLCPHSTTAPGKKATHCHTATSLTPRRRRRLSTFLQVRHINPQGPSAACGPFTTETSEPGTFYEAEVGFPIRQLREKLKETRVQKKRAIYMFLFLRVDHIRPDPDQKTPCLELSNLQYNVPERIKFL